METITIANIAAAPGAIARGLIPVGSSPAGAVHNLPLIIVNGAYDGPVLCVDAGIHGDEHEGILALFRLVERVDPKKLRGVLLAAPAVNVAALSAHQRGIPEDYLLFDPNRVYPGKADGVITERIAHVLMHEVIKHANYSVSLHSGASHVYWQPNIVSLMDEASLKLARGMGPKFDTIARKQPFVGTSQEEIIRAGVPSITVEIGGAGARHPDLFEPIVQTLTDGLSNLMTHLGMLEGRPSYPEGWKVVEQKPVRSPVGGLMIVAPGLRPGDEVAEAQTLCRIVDILGQELAVVKAPFAGTVTHMCLWYSVHTGYSLCYVSRVVETLSR